MRPHGVVLLHPRIQIDLQVVESSADFAAQHDTWIPRAQLIFEQGSDRRFRPFDRRPDVNADRARSIVDLLSEFAEVRGENLATLRKWQLTDASLALEGEHPEFGTVTLHQLLATWVTHDLSLLRNVLG